MVGGISRTEDYKGHKIDIGGHRFFSKSEKVLSWWNNILPLQAAHTIDKKISLSYQGKKHSISLPEVGPDPEAHDEVMLIRKRKSRIYFAGNFFDYPLSLSFETLRKLGVTRTIRVGWSYLMAKIFKREEKTLEDFFINRFGKELYETFFKEYTEKVWGMKCTEIKPDWGHQRVKALSLGAAIGSALRSWWHKIFRFYKAEETHTSLIEHFMYPKYGPGHLWETVAKEVKNKGGVIHFEKEVCEIHTENDVVVAVTVKGVDGTTEKIPAQVVISSMPIKHLVSALGDHAPQNVHDIAQGLPYRDFLTVGILAKRSTTQELPDDTWMYVQEKGMHAGRVQLFNNWSPYLTPHDDKVWIGVEYFCTEGDGLWGMSNESLQELAGSELAKMGLIQKEDVLDGTVIRQPKAYPAYTGTYDRFQELRAYIDTINNLYLVGRNGMHKYNNQDHSMLTAMAAVESIVSGNTNKEHIWAINTDQEYHESRS
jgi:protoporphyrinogen oxidase